MRKPILVVGIVFVVVLVVGLLWSLSSRSLASPFMVSGFFVAQDTLGSSSGDSYYEERCVDVTQYLASGYSDGGVDSHGCRLAVKSTVTNILPTFAYCDIHNSMDYAFGYPDDLRQICNGMGARTTKFIGCQAMGCPSSRCARSYTSPYCELSLVSDSKGGFERVLNYCTYDQNDLLVAESFAGGQSITKTNLRYPMKAFCRAHPSIITDDALKQSITSTNIPQDLIDGKSVSIDSGKTLTVFYTIENNANLPTICTPEKNLALDVSNPTVCKSTLGFTYLCSEGQFDALTGTCVVQPESKTLCAQGRYDVGLGACVYNPPLQVDCGANNCFYSVDRNICSCAVKDEFTCATGFTLSQPADATACTIAGGDWLSCPQCPTDKICSSDICVARCSVGQKCVFANPLAETCINANATVIGGKCVINDTTLIVCAQGSYNAKTHLCVLDVGSAQTCSDGSVPIKNSLTGVLECVNNPVAYHDCGVGEILSNGQCVKQITVYVPQSNNVTIYQEVNKGCLSDSDCNGIAVGLKCNANSGVCQTPIYYSTNYTPVYVALGIVVAGIVLLIVFGKKLLSKRRK